MKLGYLGPKGTYTEQAAYKMVSILGLPSIEFIPTDSIKDTFELLQESKIDFAVTPLKNSVSGCIYETSKALEKNIFNIVTFFDMKIKFALGIHPENKNIKITEIRSKDTALKNCSIFLKKYFPEVKTIETASTALPMKDIIDNNLLYVAAIGDEIALKNYGLKVIYNDIGDQQENFTTFILIEHRI